MIANRQSSDCEELLRQWEDAYLARAYEAAVGRLFKGIIHNLNGVLQVASFHADMSGLALDRVGQLLAQIREIAGDRAAAPLDELDSLLGEQQQGQRQFKEKVIQGSDILHRALVLPALKAENGRQWQLNDIIQCEVEFLNADAFFKHKVVKKLELDPGLPILSGDSVPVHETIHILLENALDAMRDRAEATLVAVTRASEGGVELELRDQGPGVAAAEQERIFEPFFTTRQRRSGLGLYLARRLVAGQGGKLQCLAGPGGAFRLWLPLSPAGERQDEKRVD